MSQSAKEPVSFLIDKKTRDQLDKIAAAHDRDRSHIIREAIDTYISLEEGHVEHIRRGLHDAEEDRFVDGSEVKSWIESLGSKKPQSRPTSADRKRRD